MSTYFEQLFSQLGLFAGQAFVTVISILVIAIGIAAIIAKAKQKSHFEITPLHTQVEDFKEMLESEVLSKDELKLIKKKQKKDSKKKDKKEQSIKRYFVISFKGDIKASEVENLREEISAILLIANTNDEVVVKVESPGGVVNGYGLAASQLLRLRQNNIALTVCVDQIAASGGYLMSCVANKIISAPFAIVGSIGVVAQVPNFNKFLKKHDVEYKEYTAGEYKRTVSIFGEITSKGEEKFLQQLNDTHLLFKEFVAKYRPNLDFTKIATGEYWYGETAKTLGLVDEIMTSDDYVLQAAKTSHVFKVVYEKPQKISEKLSQMLSTSIHQALTKSIESLERNRWI